MGGLVERFRVLDPEQREQTLRHLVLILTSTERDILTQTICERNDPLYRLPVELIQEVFRHLPLLKAWQLQPVCRRWRSILGSHEFLATRLARDGRLPVPTAAVPRASDEETVRHAVRQMPALRLGRPFSYYESRVQFAVPTSRVRSRVLRTVALHGHSIAYVRRPVGGGSEVVIHDIVCGQDRIFCGAARENIMCLTFTDKLLGFATPEGVLYVADLRTHELSIRLRLPSAQVIALTSDEDSIALLLGHGTVVVYSFTTKRLEAYSFAQQIKDVFNIALTPANIMLNVLRGTLDIFSYNFRTPALSDEDCADEDCPNMIHYIGHMRFHLSRSHHAPCQSLIPQASSISEVQAEQEIAIGTIQPLGTDELHRIRLETLANDHSPSSSPQEWRQDRSLVFNANTSQLHLERHRLGKRLHEEDGSSSARSPNTDPKGTLLRWQDGYYSVKWDGSVVTTFAAVGVQDDDGVGRVEKKTRLAYQGFLACGESSEEVELPGVLAAAFVNGSFLVIFAGARGDAARPGRVLVYCFGEDVRMAGGRSTGLWGPEKAICPVEMTKQQQQPASSYSLLLALTHPPPVLDSLHGSPETRLFLHPLPSIA
ncbi:hypothetical protein B0A55_08143 [Friedmanniomyces simplex]|uniref:F-box domain-containing protein n=1 Tax=Friedmanniomyces simplex TaxID=329884 RepID=A0A4U0X0E3_9PEZI|nr:hypothetical protein B0A55_08143 [Friedmanniomyces simplex]